MIDYVQQNLADGTTPESLETILAQYAARADNNAACRQALMMFRFYLCRLITNSTTEWSSPGSVDPPAEFATVSVKVTGKAARVRSEGEIICGHNPWPAARKARI